MSHQVCGTRVGQGGTKFFWDKLVPDTLYFIILRGALTRVHDRDLINKIKPRIALAAITDSNRNETNP